MKVENFKNPATVYNTNSSKFVKQTSDAVISSGSASKKSDKLELSERAKNYGQIYEKIKNGDYDKPEVINFVAKKLSAVV